MADIRMPDGTLIRGVPDGVSKSELDRKLMKAYGPERYAQMTGVSVDDLPDPDQTVAARPAVQPEPPVAQETEGPTPEQAQVRDQINVSEPMRTPGFGAPPRKPEPEQRIQDTGSLQRRLIDLNIRKPEDYGYTPEAYDRMTQELVTKEQRQQQDKAIETGATPEPGESDRGWWNFTKAAIGSVPEQIKTGLQLNADTVARMDQQDLSIGQAYLESLSNQVGDTGNKAEDILQQAAAKHGMDPESYAQYTAGMVDMLTENERQSLEDYNEIIQEVQSFKPESAEQSWLGHISAMAIENTAQLGYIAAGVATRNPALTMALLSTDVYARSYATARAEGRDPNQAAQDAFAAAAIEGATEGVPVYKIAKLMRAGKKGKAVKLLEGIGVEATQEALAELSQIAYDTGIVGKDIGVGEMFAQVRDAAVLGGLMGAVVTTPAAAFGDDQMADARSELRDSASNLKSIAMRMQNPDERVSKKEIDEAKAKHVEASRKLQKIVEERNEAKKAKDEKKAAKREAKRQKKLTPKQVAREKAQKRQSEADQTLTGAPAEEDIAMADTMEKLGKGELEESDLQGVENLLDAGYARILPSGKAALMPAGKKRLAAVRAAQEALEQGEAVQDEVIEPIPYTRPPETPPSARPQKIKPKPYKRPERRRAELLERVDEKVKDEETRNRIADAIIKAEQEAEMIEQREAVVAEKQQKQRDKDYDLAVKQLRQEEADVAEGLIEMDEKSVSGYQGTRLGDVLRAAMTTLEKQESEAKEALKDAFWNKPVQGQLFDIGQVLAKGTKDYANVVKVGALKIAKVGLKYGAWSADMVGEFGDNIKPVLANVWHDAKKQVRDVMRISHERFQSGSRKGELKYAPKQYAKGKKIDNLRKQLERLAGEGEGGRFWYEKTGKAVLKATGGDKAEARKLAGLLAIYSSGTGVGANLTNALKMWSMYKGGDLTMPERGTKAGRFSEQDRTALDWLQSEADDLHFVESFGDKRFPFFQNIMREIDPDNYEAGQGATIDMWMMRAFGYDQAAPTTAQFAFGSTEVKNLAEKLGWETQQTQAAIWVAIKARWEFIQKEAKAKAVAKGYASWIPGKRGTQVFEVNGATTEERVQNEKDIIQLFRDVALSKSIRTIEKKLEESKMDFSDFMQRHNAVISWEAEPSTDLGLNMNKMSLEDKMLMQLEVAQVLTNEETGREFLAEWLGLLGADQFVGPGAWNMAVGAATQNTVLAPPKHKAKGAEIEPMTAAAMDGYASILGFLLRQDGVAWHRPFYGKTLKGSNGAEILTETLSPEQTKQLYANIVRVAEMNGVHPDVAMNWAPIVLDGAVRVLNFTDVANRDFHKIIDEAATATGIKGDMEVFESAGDMITNDWTQNRKGEQYVEAINQNQNPEVQKAFDRAKRRFAKPIAEIYQKYAAKYQASTHGEVKVYPVDQAPKKTPKGHIRFRHFSKAKPDVISVQYFGTGIRGAERATSPSTAVQVISAYPDKGFKKEVGLGQNEYVIDVPEAELYNFDLDPLNLKELAQEPQTITGDGKVVSTRTDTQAFERAVREAGFKGYYRPDAEGNLRGQARFFHDLPVRQVDITTTPQLSGDDSAVKYTKHTDPKTAKRILESEIWSDNPEQAAEKTINAIREFGDWSAKKLGYKDYWEYNDALKAEDAAYDLFTLSPERMKAALDGDVNAIAGTGLNPDKLTPRERLSTEGLPMRDKIPLLDHNKKLIENDVIGALLRHNPETRQVLKNKAAYKARKAELEKMSRSELKDEIDRVFDTGTTKERMQRRGMAVVMPQLKAGGRVIKIKENELDEYEVRQKDGEIYYTEDPDDAINTARRIYGNDVTIRIVDDMGDTILIEPPLTQSGSPALKLKADPNIAEKVEAANEFLDALFEETELNPLTGGRVLNGNVSLDVETRNGEIWIDAVVAHERGRGHGTKAMQLIVELADMHGATLNLFAEAFLEDGDGPTTADLVEWYKQQGFVTTRGQHMVRAPQNQGTTPSVKKPKKSSNRGYGLPMWQAQSIADEFMAQSGLDNVVVVPDVTGLPEETYEFVVSRGWDGRLKGLFVNDPANGRQVLYVVADAMYSQELNTWGEPNPVVMQKTMLHEAIGHFGTRAFLGKDYPRIMDQIIAAMPAAVEAQRKHAGRGKSRTEMHLSAEEVIAYTAQEELLGLDLSKIKVTMLDKIVQAFRQFLIRMGWAEFTRDDLLTLIFRAANFTQKNSMRTLQKRADIASKMVGAREAMGMVSYHGSPHMFDMFDMSKIGTGEGNQAYGWGLYFAESADVAGQYRRNLSLRYAGESVKAIDKKIADVKKNVQGPQRASALRELKAQRKMAQEESRVSGGHTYEVDIADDAMDRMLDWDAPLSEQTESVRRAIERLIQQEDALVSQAPLSRTLYQQERAKYSESITGRELYDLFGSHRTPKDTSLLLSQGGIPGIKFLDQGSRTSPVNAGGGFIKPAIQAVTGKTQEPTRNLVLFTTNVINVVKRDGEIVFAKTLAYEEMPDGSKRAYDPVTGKEWGTVLPTVPESVLRASPGIQSWSIDGAKNTPTMAPSLQGAPNLAKDREADPDLDRFLNKIGHHKHNRLDAFKDWWDGMKGRWKRSFEIEVIDRYAGIKHAEQDLMIFGEESGYMSVRIAAGVDVMLRSAMENGVPVWEPDGSVSFDEGSKGLIEILAPVGQNPEMLKMFEAFIVARRAKFLHKDARERLISREEIAAVLGYVRKNKLYKLFDQTQKEMAQFKGRVLDFAEDAGLIDSDTRHMWERNDHVPFYRVLTGDKTGPFAGSRIGQVGKVIRHLRGGTETLKNPLESIVQNIGVLIEASVKNRAMADIVRNFNGTGIVTKAPQAETSTALVDLKQIQDMLDEAGVSIDAVGRDMLDGIQKLYSLQAPTADNIVSVQENGHKQYYYVHDTGIMRGLETHPKPQAFVEFIMRVLRFPKRVLTRAITLTPDFILKNWFRDMWHSYVLGRHGTVVPVYDSIKGWGHAIANDKTLKDMMSGGGMFDAGYVNASDPNRTQIAMRKALLGAGRGNILDTPRKLMRFYMRIANGAENAHRVAVFQKALAATGSRKQAIYEARDIMDFAVRGANPIVRFLTETVPFWGARVQGLSRVGRGFKEHPMQVFLRGLPMMLATVALYAINRDDDRYKKLPEYEKRMYYHFFDVFEDGDHWRLPKPFEIGSVFSSIPEVLTEAILSDQPDRGKALGESIAFIVTEMLMLSPQVQILTPIYELDRNKNLFTGAPIVTTWDQKMDPYMQYGARTNLSVKWLAQHMPDGAPDFMRSPKKLEHLLRGYFGSMMDYAMIASDLTFANMMNEPPQPSLLYDEMPFVKAFRREENPRYDKYIDTLYTVLEDADKIYNAMNEAEEVGDYEAADRLFDKNQALLAAREEMTSARKEMRKINNEIREIYLDEKMTPTQKREELDALLKDRSDVAKDVYDYRPGGKENPVDGNKDKESILDLIIGMNKKDQVDTLIAAELPNTAVLVNDIRISQKKLEGATSG